MRNLIRQRGVDSSIGWVSFSDTILFAFGLVIVFANSLSDALVSKSNEYDSLTSDHGSLVAEYSDLLDELEQQKKLLIDSEKELSTTRIELASLQTDLSESKSKLTDLNTNLSKLHQEQKRLLKTKKELENKFAKAREIYFSQKTRISQLLDRLKESEEILAQLTEAKTQLTVVQASYNEMLDRLRQRERDERRVRGELLGLKGSLNRVAVVFDASQSMMTGNRWDSAQQVMLDWVDHLDMKECKLVVFSDQVMQFPEGDTLLMLQGEKGEEDRTKMRKFLELVKPSGRTNTLAALQAAYRVEGLDTIVLFTDGAPYVSGGQQRYDTKMVEEIYGLCEDHPEIPINAVGLGDYFSPELSAFLLQISEITQGTFIGR